MLENSRLLGDLVALRDLYPFWSMFSLPGETEPLLSLMDHFCLPLPLPPVCLPSPSCLSLEYWVWDDPNWDLLEYCWDPTLEYCWDLLVSVLPSDDDLSRLLEVLTDWLRSSLLL